MIFVDGDRVYAQCPFNENARAKGIPGARWNPKRKAWYWPLTPAFAWQVNAEFGPCEDLSEQLAAVSRRREARRVVDANLHGGYKYAFETPPWDHQRRATVYAMLTDACLLDMWMGTGKTKCVFDAIRARDHRRVLVLCPKSVIDVWEREHRKHGDPTLKVFPLSTGTTKKRAGMLKFAVEHHKRVAVVMNYEAVLGDAMRSAVLDVEWDAVIYDEIHRIKAPIGKTSKLCAKIKAAHRIGLTGTPMPHSPLDVFGQYRALDPGVFGTSFVHFRSEYAVMGGYEGKQVLSFKNQDRLRAKMDTLRLHVPGDVLDLPELQVVDVDVKLTGDAARRYAEMEKEFITQVGEHVITASNALAKLLKLQEITSGFLYVEDEDGEQVQVQASTAKIDALSEFFEDLPHGEPVVVFARFKHDLAAIREIAEKHDRTTGELSGSHDDMAAWHRGDVDVLAVQIQSGGVGIDLTRARYAVYYSMGYSLGEYQQSIARIHRPGQDRATFIYRLIATGTVDRKIARALERREDIVKSILAEIEPS